MTRVSAMLIAAVLLLSPACVQQPDWIESTLVTVDVTGLWEGWVAGSPGMAGVGDQRATLNLEQEGPKVRGRFDLGTGGYGGLNSGPIEGRVGGDVLHFRVMGGRGETVTGEVTVSGDEMEGMITTPRRELTMPHRIPNVRILLRRVDAPSRSQGP
jgi:hypothetical protein